MNRFDVNKINLFLVFLLLGVSLSAQSPKFVLPKLLLKNITNNTEHAIVIVDTLNKKNVAAIAAGETANLNFEATTKNLIIKGSMKDAMADAAQYIIKRVDAKDNEQLVFVHMNLSQGGVDDGSEIIAGKPSSAIFKFFLAGKKGGCVMSLADFEYNNDTVVEVSLVLSVPQWAIDENVFALTTDYTVRKNAEN